MPRRRGHTIFSQVRAAYPRANITMISGSNYQVSFKVDSAHYQALSAQFGGKAFGFEANKLPERSYQCSFVFSKSNQPEFIKLFNAFLKEKSKINQQDYPQRGLLSGAYEMILEHPGRSNGAAAALPSGEFGAVMEGTASASSLPGSSDDHLVLPKESFEVVGETKVGENISELWKKPAKSVNAEGSDDGFVLVAAKNDTALAEQRP